MLEDKKVYIFGYSGHAFVVLDSLKNLGFKVEGYFDYEEASFNPYEIPYLGFENKVDVKAIVKDAFVFPTVGDNGIRKKIIQMFDELQLNQCVVIDPTAAVSSTANIGFSTYIGKQSAVNACANLGKGVIINTHAVIEHECEIGDYVHIAPGSILCGNVKIDENSFVGANTVIRQNIKVISNTTIGSGSVVVTSIKEQGIWLGSPARKRFV